MSSLMPLSKVIMEYLSETPSSILARFSKSVGTKFDQIELYFIILVQQHSILLQTPYGPP